MREAGSLDEASGIFGDYYCEDQYRAQYLVGDSAGASMIVEGDEILMKQGPFQVVTNFYQSHPELGGYPCWRHETATSMLSQAESVSPLLVGEVLDATHQEGKYPTQYSTIYDLRRRIVYLFYYHNFHEHVRIDLAEELRRGARHHDISPLFSNVRPVAPVDGATIPGTSVEFRWTGKSTSAYQVCLSTSPDPTDSCTSIQPVIAGGTFLGGLRLPGTGLLLGLALLASVVWSRTRLVTVVAAVLIGAVAGCGTGATDPPGPTDDVVELRYFVACQPGAAPLSDQDVTAIRSLGESYAQAVLAMDADAAAALYADDAIEMPSNEPATVGREAIRERYTGAFQLGMASSEFTLTSADIDGMDGLAYDRGTWTWLWTVAIWNSELPLPQPESAADEAQVE